MGVVTQQFDKGATYRITSNKIVFSIPDAGSGPTQFYNQTDLTGLSAGDVLTTSKGYGWPWTLSITLSDAASSDLSVDLTIIGIDHFGNEVTETMTSLGDGVHITTNIYAMVISVTLDAISNGAAGDVLQIGCRGSAGSDADATDSGSFALPLGVTEASDVLGVFMSNIDRLANGSMQVDVAGRRVDIISEFNTSGVYGVIVLDPRKEWAY